MNQCNMKKEAVIIFKTTHEEKNRLLQRAEYLGLTLSDVVRLKLNNIKL